MAKAKKLTENAFRALRNMVHGYGTLLIGNQNTVVTVAGPTAGVLVKAGLAVRYAASPWQVGLRITEAGRKLIESKE